MAFKRLLPFYEQNRPDYELKKILVEIKYHERMLKDATKLLKEEKNLRGSMWYCPYHPNLNFSNWIDYHKHMTLEHR